ncbi:DUF2779 domain-containing protein [Candidatus Gracilibacteria bacterium]|nr:DUF2779 domain-containing protein [Candidatus Gracilibacteria bacterium]
MQKPITKSLFVDYCDFEKLARWKVNNSEVYKKIRKIESEEQEEHIMSIGQAVEELVKKYLTLKYQSVPVNLMPEVKSDKEIVDEEDEEQEDFVYFPKGGVDPWTVITHNTRATLEAIHNKEKILYQPGFMIDGCFVRADFMVLQDNGQYDLIEVKAKSGIRKEVSHEGNKSKIGEIDDKFKNDTSFQKWVINKTLEKEGLPLLGDVYLYYLNKEYIKNGEIDPEQLVAKDQMGIQTSVLIAGEKKDKEINRVDQFIAPQTIEKLVEIMKKELRLSEEDFNKIHIFPGNKYLNYFGKKPNFGTICAIPKMHYSKAPVVQNLYFKDRLNLLDLTEEEKDGFNSADSLGSVREFIERYIHCTKTEEVIIDKDSIRKIIGDFKYPICFYDYETISVPIPLFDNSYAYQQVPVQYSLHKYYEDGRMEHFGGVLVGQGERKIELINIENNPNQVESESEKIISGSYKDLLQELLNDIGGHIDNSTFIVWYKPFENTRNKEVGKIFTDIQDSFLKINESTYDLMEIFSQNFYFDLEFHGSNSIKKVLPVMVPSMTYEGMKVGNGGVAMQKLEKLINGEISDSTIRMEAIKSLLLYCGQDSLAMVKIFESLEKV